MSFYDFNATFFLSLGTLLITGTSVCLAYALKSKCSQVKLCCGCLEIVRDIDAELEENEQQIISLEPQATRSPPRSRRPSHIFGNITENRLI